MIKLLLLLLTALVVCAGETSSPDQLTCPLCHGDGLCHATGCDKGSRLCSGDCLKKEVGPWIKMDVPGHNTSELWRKFSWKSADGSGHWTAFNQQHIGQVVRLVDGEYKNLGICPLCKGTTRIECPACKGDGKCPVCHGKKALVQGTDMFTISDIKGRSLTLIPLTLIGDSVEGLRIPDLQKVTIPLAAVTPTSADTLRKAIGPKG